MDYKKLHQETLQGLERLVAEGRISEAEAQFICPDFVAESKDEKIRTRLIALVEAFGQGKHKDEMLAYLERQKEQKPTVEEVLLKAGLKPFKDGNQWCILVGDNIQEGICGFGDAIEDALFEFLREVCKVQQPAEWSEEDEKILKDCIDMPYSADFISRERKEDAIRWLKSLRPQPHWKPSEHQLEVLHLVAEKYGSCLMGLYEDLKKL